MDLRRGVGGHLVQTSHSMRTQEMSTRGVPHGCCTDSTVCGAIAVYDLPFLRR